MSAGSIFIFTATAVKLLESSTQCAELLKLVHSFHWHVQNAWLFAVLRNFFHSSLLYTLSFHHFPLPSLPSSLTSSRHLFLGLPLSIVSSKFMFNAFLGILFPSILCSWPNQRNLFNLIVSVIVGRMKWAGHVARMGEERGCIGSWWVNRREGDHWGDLGVDGWIILGWISRRWDVGIWTG